MNRQPSQAELDDWGLRLVMNYLLRQVRIAHPECFTSQGTIIAHQFHNWLHGTKEKDPDIELLRQLLWRR